MPCQKPVSHQFRRDQRLRHSQPFQYSLRLRHNQPFRHDLRPYHDLRQIPPPCCCQRRSHFLGHQIPPRCPVLPDRCQNRQMAAMFLRHRHYTLCQMCLPVLRQRTGSTEALHRLQYCQSLRHLPVMHRSRGCHSFQAPAPGVLRPTVLPALPQGTGLACSILSRR